MTRKLLVLQIFIVNFTFKTIKLFLGPKCRLNNIGHKVSKQKLYIYQVIRVLIFHHYIKNVKRILAVRLIRYQSMQLKGQL